MRGHRSVIATVGADWAPPASTARGSSIAPGDQWACGSLERPRTSRPRSPRSGSRTSGWGTSCGGPATSVSTPGTAGSSRRSIRTTVSSAAPHSRRTGPSDRRANGEHLIRRTRRTCPARSRRDLARHHICTPSATMSPSKPDRPPAQVAETVASMGSLYARAEASLNPHQRSIEALTRRLGRPGSIYVIFGSVTAWILVNLALSASGSRPVDPAPFEWLQGVLTLASVLMTTMVLTTQNRQSRHAEERGRLDLEVNLLSEAKVTKLIMLLEELRRDLPDVPNRHDSDIEAMKETVDPQRVLAALEETLEVGDREHRGE